MDDFQAEVGLTKVLGMKYMAGLKSFRVGQMGTPQVTLTFCFQLNNQLTYLSGRDNYFAVSWQMFHV